MVVKKIHQLQNDNAFHEGNQITKYGGIGK